MLASSLWSCFDYLLILLYLLSFSVTYYWRHYEKRQYNPQLITIAYNNVTEKGVSVYKAAQMYGIPEITLRAKLWEYSLLWKTQRIRLAQAQQHIFQR